MKRLLIFIVLFFIAVASAPYLIDEKGYILIKIGDHARETTVTAATAMLIFICLSLLVFSWLIKRSFSFSLGAWHKITFASKRRTLKNLNRGIAAYLTGDYQLAERLLAKSDKSTKFQSIALLMAASAAQKQSLNELTQRYLTQLDNSLDTVKEKSVEVVLVTVKLLIDQQAYQQARATLNDYQQSLSNDAGLFALDIELSLIEQRYEFVVEQLNSARKNKHFSDDKITDWELAAYYGVFNQQITLHDSSTLVSYWETLSRKIKQRDAIVIAYCRVLATHNVDKPLVKLLLPIIKKGSKEKLIKALCRLPLNTPDELILATQKQLHKQPNSAKWLSCLAHLALAGKQFSMAEKAFKSLLNLEEKQYSKTDLLAFANVQQQQGHYLHAIELLKSLDSVATD
jgi:HemY protein